MKYVFVTKIDKSDVPKCACIDTCDNVWLLIFHLKRSLLQNFSAKLLLKSKVDNVKYTFNLSDITATVATDECRLT